MNKPHQETILPNTNETHSQSVSADVEAAEVVVTGEVDITPTWGEAGLLFWRIAISGNQSQALVEMKQDYAKAWAAMEGVRQLMPTLTPEQKELLNKVMAAEIKKLT